MRCLCCNKEIKDPSGYEAAVSWHSRCIRSFFGTARLPEIDCSKKQLEELANSAVNKGLTVPGVQKKLSLHLSTENGNSRLTIVDHPTGFILKPQSEGFEALPEAEYLSMELASYAGIKTVPHALIRFGDEYSYITRRIDRIRDKKLAMEDFCQLSKRPTADKYKGSYEICGNIIRSYSKNIGLDMAEFYYRLLFCFTTGNSDMHLKNFSLIEDEPGSRIFGLSAAYDMLPVNIVMPADKEEMALTVNGKKRNIRKKDLLMLAESLNIPESTAKRFMVRIVGYEKEFGERITSSYIPDKMKEQFRGLIAKRLSVFGL